MTSESKSIATVSTNINNRIHEIKDELRESNKTNTEIKELRTELQELKEKQEHMKIMVENTLYKIIEKTNKSRIMGTNIILVLLASEFIIASGFNIVKDKELQQMSEYLGYENYSVCNNFGFLDVYFYNGEFEEVQEC